MKVNHDIDTRSIILPLGGYGTISALHISRIYRIKKNFQEWLYSIRFTKGKSIYTTLSARMYEHLGSLPEISQVAIFDHPIAKYYLSCINKEGAEQTLVKLAGLFAGRSPGRMMVIPGNTIAAAGLALPHLNIILFPSSLSLCIRDADVVTEITWSDGFTLTADAFKSLKNPYVASRYMKGCSIGPFSCMNSFSLFKMADLPGHKNVPAPKDLEIVSKGYNLLKQVWPESAADIAMNMNHLLLLRYNKKFIASVTTDELPNTFVSSVADAVTAAETMVHEASHMRLSYLLEIDMLVKNGWQPVHPSPWRTDLRPLTGLLNGVHAFVNVYIYYSRLAGRHIPLKQKKNYQLLSEGQKEKIVTAWRYFEKHARPTALGEKVMYEMDNAINKIENGYEC